MLSRGGGAGKSREEYDKHKRKRDDARRALRRLTRDLAKAQGKKVKNRLEKQKQNLERGSREGNSTEMAERATHRIGHTHRPGRERSVAGALSGLLGIDAYRTEFEEVGRRICALSRMERRRLLRACQSSFASPSSRSDEATRVTTAKIAVALIPDSMSLIRSWLKRRGGDDIYEVHFSLFCFLDHVNHENANEHVRGEVLGLLKEYLFNTKSDTAYATWMAGHLLGDHWDIREALPILIDAVVNARYAAGRRGAAQGLQDIAERLPNPKR